MIKPMPLFLFLSCLYCLCAYYPVSQVGGSFMLFCFTFIFLLAASHAAQVVLKLTVDKAGFKSPILLP